MSSFGHKSFHQMNLPWVHWFRFWKRNAFSEVYQCDKKGKRIWTRNQANQNCKRSSRTQWTSIEKDSLHCTREIYQGNAHAHWYIFVMTRLVDWNDFEPLPPSNDFFSLSNSFDGGGVSKAYQCAFDRWLTMIFRAQNKFRCQNILMR